MPPELPPELPPSAMLGVDADASDAAPQGYASLRRKDATLHAHLDDDQALLCNVLADDPANEAFRGEGGVELFKKHLFDKLLHPEQHSLPFCEHIAGESRTDPIWFLDLFNWRTQTAPHAPDVIEGLLRGEATVVHDGSMGSDRTHAPKRLSPATKTRLHLGRLGNWNWTHVPPEPVGLLFTRGITGVNMAQGPLLRAYEETGDERLLDAWTTITDDWARHFTAAADRCTDANVRFYFVTCLYDFLLAFLGELARVARRRPAFVAQVNGGVLLRTLVTCLIEYAPTTVRQLRALVINHRPAGIVMLVLTGLIFYELKLGRWCLAQAKRLWETNWALRTFPDGGPVEWGDIGHEQMDMIYLGNLLKRVQAMSRHHPGVRGWLDGSDPLWAIPEADARLANARYILRHLKPDGHRFRWDAVTSQREAILGAASNEEADALLQRMLRDAAAAGQLDMASPIFSSTPSRNTPAVLGSVINVAPELLVREGACAALVDAVFGPLPALETVAGEWRDVHLDALQLDILPFKGQIYMRDGWDCDDFAFASFISRPSPSSNGRNDDGRLQLYGHGQHLVNMPPVRVNGMPPNRYAVQEWPLHDKVGGKTTHILHGLRGDILRTRAHRGAVFDLAEGTYTGGYQSARPPHATLDHPQHVRQVLLLRPLGAWLVVDRVVARDPVTVDIDVEAMLARYEWDPPAALQVDGDEGRMRASSMGMAGWLLQQATPSNVNLSYVAPIGDAASAACSGSTTPMPPNQWARSGIRRFRRTIVEPRTMTARLETPMPEHLLLSLLLPQRGCAPVFVIRDARRQRTYEGRIIEVHAGPPESVTLELLNGSRHEKLPLADLEPEDADHVRRWTPSILPQAHETAMRAFDARFDVRSSNELSSASITVTDRAQNTTTWILSRRTTRPATVSRAAPSAPLVAGRLMSTNAELFVVCDRGDGTVAALVLGCTDRTVTHTPTGRRISLPSADVEFVIETATGNVWTASRIETPVPPLSFESTMPTAFSSPLRVRLARPPSDTTVHFTIDGRDPTPNDPMYDITEPPCLYATTLFKARAFRRRQGKELRVDVDVHPLTLCLIESPVLSAVFEHRVPREMSLGGEQPRARGLAMRAAAGPWMDLMANAEWVGEHAVPVRHLAPFPLDAESVSAARSAVQQAPHQGLWVQFEGILWVHTASVHTLFAPIDWSAPWNVECAYDLRVYVDDEEWQPSTQRALYGRWSLPLTAGGHKLRVVWVDCRTPAYRSDTWRDFPAKHVLRKDPVPVLEWDAGRPGHRETFGLGCCFSNQA